MPLGTSSFAFGYLILCRRVISEAWQGSAPRKSSDISLAGKFSAISLSFSSLAWQPGHPLNQHLPEPIGGRWGLPALPCGPTLPVQCECYCASLTISDSNCVLVPCSRKDDLPPSLWFGLLRKTQKKKPLNQSSQGKMKKSAVLLLESGVLVSWG